MDPRTVERAHEAWRRLDSAATPRAFAAHGRVNLIGEHVDYHGGPVLPVAIDAGVVAVASLRADRRVRLRSADFEGPVEFDLDAGTSLGGWARYPAGVVRELLARDLAVSGLDLGFAGSVPQGAGLSSSAAVLVATATALDQLLDLRLSPEEIARLAHDAETRHVGVPCGIMDPFASALAREGHALHLDCRDASHRDVPLPTDRLSLCVFDSGTRHELSDGAYQQRVEEGARALAGLRRLAPELRDLADVDAQTLDRAASALDPTSLRRARHVVGEVARVGRARRALERGALFEFGEQLLLSHLSLRSLYEVSTDRLDDLFLAVSEHPRAYGGRLTGAGFGGCLLAVVQRGAEDEVRRHVEARFEARHDGPLRSWTLGFGRAPGEVEG